MTRLSALVLLLVIGFFSSPSEAYRSVTSCPNTIVTWPAGTVGADPAVDIYGNVCVANAEPSQFPQGATPLTISTTGTTEATTATIAATASVTNYLCGFAIRANATAAATGTATVTGVITATMSFVQWTAPLASGIGTVEQNFYPCIPASAANTAIAVISAAPGAGGTVSVTAWGYRK